MHEGAYMWSNTSVKEKEGLSAEGLIRGEIRRQLMINDQRLTTND